MPPQVYLSLKILHVVFAFALFASLGAITLADSRRKGATILHGVSLLLILLLGFAMLQSPPPGQYWWIGKLALWLFIGAAPTLSKRKILPPPVVLALCLAAAAAAAWLAIFKPF